MKPGYFEVQRPRYYEYGVCSDNQCPCNEDVLSPGNGYLYISEDLVQFRKDALTLQETEQKVLSYTRNAKKGTRIIIDQDLYVPILMCRQGAIRRGIDMEIAAADAEYFWETGLVPLRPTPQKKRLAIKTKLHSLSSTLQPSHTKSEKPRQEGNLSPSKPQAQTSQSGRFSVSRILSIGILAGLGLLVVLLVRSCLSNESPSPSSAPIPSQSKTVPKQPIAILKN